MNYEALVCGLCCNWVWFVGDKHIGGSVECPNWREAPPCGEDPRCGGDGQCDFHDPYALPETDQEWELEYAMLQFAHGLVREVRHGEEVLPLVTHYRPVPGEDKEVMF